MEDGGSHELMTGLFRNPEGVEGAYDCLRVRGYTNRDVSVLMSDDTRAGYVPAKTEAGTKAAVGAGTGVVAGAGLGALLAGLAAAGIAVPGLPIIAMGPLAAAFAGAGAGGALGALAGALVGSGIPEERATLYEKGVNEGGVVLGFTPRTATDADDIEREWRAAGGEQIYRPISAVGRRA